MFAFLILFPLFMAPVCLLASRRSNSLRNLTAIAACSAEFAAAVLLACLPGRSASVPGVCGHGLSFTADGFRKLYCLIITFAWLATVLFGSEYFSHDAHASRYYFFNLMTLGATIGVFLSSSLLTALVFFEIMSFTSYTWVIQDETEEASRAAGTYLAVAVIGGMAALMGLFLLQSELGTTEISLLYERAAQFGKQPLLYAAGGCVLFGFGAKAGMFPLHIWLPKAHPVAPAPASALLSGVLTKSGIFGVAAITCNLFRSDPKWGTMIVLLGTVTMVLGAVLALFSVNLKRTLACSSVSQIGFILIGVGMIPVLGGEGSMAASGALLHMMNHSLFKLVLFLSAGAVYMNTHKLDLNEIRGFGRNKPLLKAVFLSGALGIGGFPLFSGYISKTLLHESIAEHAAELAAAGRSALLFRSVEWLFLFSGGMTVAYMTKLFVVLFVEKNRDPVIQSQYDSKTAYLRPASICALLIPAALILLFGSVPSLFMDRIAAAGMGFFRTEPLAHAVPYFSWSCLKGALVSIVIGALLYFLFVRTCLMKRSRETGTTEYPDLWPARLDLEELVYRPLILRWIPSVLGTVSAVFGENRVSGWLAKEMFAAFRWIAWVFGSNRVTGPSAEKLARSAEIAAHAFSDSLDAFVYLLRKTVYRDSPPPATDEVSTSSAYRLGALRDMAESALGRQKDAKTDYATLYYRRKVTEDRARNKLTGNLSFGLIMFCIAAVGVLMYVLFLDRI
ncbi:MAG: NADH dehydrogenase [Clostridia bacterium]|nr:NADH dehydrogenase [Clostridia bacterium]